MRRGADDVAEDAEDVDLELVEPVALEHRAADADHPGLELVDGKGPALGREAGRQKQHERNGRGESSDKHRNAGSTLKVRVNRRNCKAPEPLMFDRNSLDTALV